MRSALHGGELGADEILPQVVEFLLAQRGTAQAQLQNRHAGGVVFQNVRRKDSRRQHAQDGLNDRGDLRDRQLDVDIRMEENLDHRDAVVRLRFDVLDVVDRGGHGAFGDGDDALFHFVRRESGIGPDDADDRDIDVGKDVRRHREDGQAPQHADQNRHHQEGKRPAQRESDNPHKISVPKGRLRHDRGRFRRESPKKYSLFRDPARPLTAP